MANIGYWYEEYSKESTLLSEMIAQLQSSTAPPAAQHAMVMACDTKINRIRDVKKSYGLELRMTQNRAEKASFDTKGKELDSLFNKLVSDMSELRERSREQDKKDLLAGNKTRFNTEGRDNDDLLNDAAGIQDETMASVARSRALVEASHEIGTATLEVLTTQREQINDVSNEIDAIDNNLTRAEKLITAFGKRMATDRILQFFTAVNVILIIAVVAYAATHKKKLEGSSGDGGGDSP